MLKAHVGTIQRNGDFITMQKVIVKNEHGKVQHCEKFSIDPSNVWEAGSYCHLDD